MLVKVVSAHKSKHKLQLLIRRRAVWIWISTISTLIKRKMKGNKGKLRRLK